MSEGEKTARIAGLILSIESERAFRPKHPHPHSDQTPNSDLESRIRPLEPGPEARAPGRIPLWRPAVATTIRVHGRALRQRFKAAEPDPGLGAIGRASKPPVIERPDRTSLGE